MKSGSALMMILLMADVKSNAIIARKWKLKQMMMKFRFIKSEGSFFVFPTIIFVYEKFLYGHYEIAFVWLKCYFCIEWK